MGARLQYDQLPPHVRAKVDRMMTSDRPAPVVAKPVAPVAESPCPKMTKTEREFGARLAAIYGAQNVHFEWITVRMANGHRYTPDFVVVHGSTLVMYEVKGGYRLGSYQRARLAFDQCRIECPFWTFVWAEKRDGKWVES